jgi:hypothetical protein
MRFWCSRLKPNKAFERTTSKTCRTGIESTQLIIGRMAVHWWMCWYRMCSLNNVRTTAHILHMAHSMSAASLVLYCKFVVNFILFFRRGGSLTRQASTSVAKTSWAWIVDAVASILHCWMTSLHIQSNAFSTFREWGYRSPDMCYRNWVLFDSLK